MPFCPNCKFEYVPSLTRCPECGEQLVESLPVEAQEPLDEEGFEQVLLCTLVGEPHASLLRNALAAAGIPIRASLESPNPYLGVSLLAGSVAPVHIYVNRRDLPRAQIICRDHEARQRP